VTWGEAWRWARLVLWLGAGVLLFRLVVDGQATEGWHLPAFLGGR
jgi:hypothetical protein